MMMNSWMNSMVRWNLIAAVGIFSMATSTSAYSQGGGGGGIGSDEGIGSSPVGRADDNDPFSENTEANRLLAEQFVKKFRGVVRLTLVVRVSNVVAHVRSAAAVVISGQGASTVGTRFPVLATSDSVFDPPSDDWYKDSPADARSYSVYIQDPRSNGHSTTIQFANMGGMGGLAPGYGESTMGAPVGFTGGSEYRKSAYGMVTLPGVGDELVLICESDSLETIKSTLGGLAFVSATISLNNIWLKEVSLLKARTSNDTKDKDSVETCTFSDSASPLSRFANTKPVAGDVQVTDDGFKALFVDSVDSKNATPVSASEILAAFVKSIKNSQTNKPQYPSYPATTNYSLSQPQEPANETNKLLAEIIAIYRSSESPDEKSRAKAQIEQTLSEQFDAQRSIKKLEIQELRERLNELEKQEELRMSKKQEIIASKLKQLIRE
jgi:hypothetical protein